MMIYSKIWCDKYEGILSFKEWQLIDIISFNDNAEWDADCVWQK